MLCQILKLNLHILTFGQNYTNDVIVDYLQKQMFLSGFKDHFESVILGGQQGYENTLKLSQLLL